MVGTYRDVVHCPAGHEIVVAKRRVATAGKKVAQYCEDCNAWHKIAAGPYPGQPTPRKRDAIRESQIEARLIKRVKELGGECRKVRWVGRTGAPDRLVMLPWYSAKGDTIDTTIWVELKAPGHKAQPHQAREHERMRRMGQRVELVDSYERIEEILK